MESFDEDSAIEEPELFQVYLRLKPCKVPSTLYDIRSENSLVLTVRPGQGRQTPNNAFKIYQFTKIFRADSDQKEIFESVVQDNLRKLPDGQKFTLLTYGASGSGKTHTLMGTVGAPGLVPRSLEHVFRLVDATKQPAFKPAENGAQKLSHDQQDYELKLVKRLRRLSAPHRKKYRRMSHTLQHTDLVGNSMDLSNRNRHYVWVSFVEIYNEKVYDLLAPPHNRVNLKIREDSSGNVYVQGATQAFVRSGEEAYDVLAAGKHNLVVAATGVHGDSSRSHCIFTITMLTETAEGSVRTSYVRLCDLAGCERARATCNTGARMAESCSINSSLHVLERCLHMLRRKQKNRNDAMVPYRESKLTRLLGTGLSGARGEAVSMVVTLNPSPEYEPQAKHVLNLAVVAQDIEIHPRMFATTSESSTQDTTISCSSEVLKLRVDNERLHFELGLADAQIKAQTRSMEELRQESANTMLELVEEAKDMTKQYYEARLEALRSEMADMVEEYESRLAMVPAPPKTDAGTSSHFLHNTEKLTTEIFIKERKGKENVYTKKAVKDTTPPQEVVSLSDTDTDEDSNDLIHQSLEPIIKKKLYKSKTIVDSDLDKSHETREKDDSKNNENLNKDPVTNVSKISESAEVDTGKDENEGILAECESKSRRKDDEGDGNDKLKDIVQKLQILCLQSEFSDVTMSHETREKDDSKNNENLNKDPVTNVSKISESAEVDTGKDENEGILAECESKSRRKDDEGDGNDKLKDIVQKLQILCLQSEFSDVTMSHETREKDDSKNNENLNKDPVTNVSKISESAEVDTGKDENEGILAECESKSRRKDDEGDGNDKLKDIVQKLQILCLQSEFSDVTMSHETREKDDSKNNENLNKDPVTNVSKISESAEVDTGKDENEGILAECESKSRRKDDEGDGNDKLKDIVQKLQILCLQSEFSDVTMSHETREKDDSKNNENLNKDPVTNVSKISESAEVDTGKDENEGILAECESKSRRKDDEGDGNDKLKDIVQKMQILCLQSEFSDVTMGLPATKNQVKDIPSPEKVDEEIS